jgi:hypothetical protein
MMKEGLLTADGLKARLEERRADERPITADDLKAVKEAFENLDGKVRHDCSSLSYSDFAVIIRVVAEISAQVGGVEVAARSAEVLAELTGGD